MNGLMNLECQNPGQASPNRVIVVEDFHPFRRFVCSQLEQRPEIDVFTTGEIEGNFRTIPRDYVITDNNKMELNTMIPITMAISEIEERLCLPYD